VGLLSPSHYTDAGHRLYTDADFVRLQQILALKFLGFSLEEIRQCICNGPAVLPEALKLQKAMMQEKRSQLDTVIEAITRTEALLQKNEHDWDSIVSVIQVIQMQNANDWRNKYFSPEEMRKMEELNQKYYSEEQRRQLAEWGSNFTEADQQTATRQWSEWQAQLSHLVATTADPASPEAQELVRQQQDLLQQFTHGDPAIAQSLKNMYADLKQMPAAERPYAMPYSEEEGIFLNKALEIYHQHQY
jgi:DNA-binding transcriptional MerR regulator